MSSLVDEASHAADYCPRISLLTSRVTHATLNVYHIQSVADVSLHRANLLAPNQCRSDRSTMPDRSKSIAAEVPPTASPAPVPSSPDATPPAARVTARRAAIAGGAGTLIEYYDFASFGFLAVVIAPLFFPAGGPAVSVLLTLAVFGSAYLMRPVGGWFFGRLGDRTGRRRALVITVVAMGICSGLMGVLPTHSSVGLLAPILMVILRLAQGFCTGGEIGGAATYVAESAPSHRRGFYGSIIPQGANLGFATAAAVVGLVSTLTSADQLLSWGWRIPFLIAFPLAAMSLWMRLKLEDTTEFKEMASRHEVVRSPFRVLLRSNWRSVLQVVGMAIAMNGAGYIGLTYFSVYLIQDLKFEKQAVYWTSALAIGLSCALYPWFGTMVDRFGRRKVLLGSYIATLIVAWPSFAILGSTRSMLVVGLVYFVYTSCNGASLVPAFTQFTELFPRRVRYSGVALGFNIGSILAGGSAPYIAAQLTQSTGNPMAPSYWVIAVSIVGIITVLTLRETGRSRLPV